MELQTPNTPEKFTQNIIAGYNKLISDLAKNAEGFTFKLRNNPSSVFVSIVLIVNARPSGMFSVTFPKWSFPSLRNTEERKTILSTVNEPRLLGKEFWSLVFGVSDATIINDLRNVCPAKTRPGNKKFAAATNIDTFVESIHRVVSVFPKYYSVREFEELGGDHQIIKVGKLGGDVIFFPVWDNAEEALPKEARRRCYALLKDSQMTLPKFHPTLAKMFGVTLQTVKSDLR